MPKDDKTISKLGARSNDTDEALKHIGDVELDAEEELAREASLDNAINSTEAKEFSAINGPHSSAGVSGENRSTRGLEEETLHVKDVIRQSAFGRFCGHFKTITRHKIMVCRYCFKIGLYRQGLTHDSSKYSPSEFWVGVKYFQGTSSPNNAERKSIGVSTAWCHHKGHNKHHFEYWLDYGEEGFRCGTILEGKRMPRRYVAEMFVDRMCASKNYNIHTYTNDMPLQYYQRGDKNGWLMHEDTKAELEMLLTMLAQHGEDKTLRYIREVFLKEA